MSCSARRPAGGRCRCALRSPRRLPAVQHSLQMRCRVLDVIVSVLAGAAFPRQHATAVDHFEIPIGKFVVSLGLLGLLVVDPQIPLAVFVKTMEANELIFLLCGRPVLAPCITLVEYKLSFVDKLFGMLKCPSIKRHGHGCSPLRVATHPIMVPRTGVLVLPRTAFHNRQSRTHGAMMAINFQDRFVKSPPTTANLSLTDANARRGVRCYARECCGPSVADHLKWWRRSIFIETKEWRSHDEKKSDHTRGWRDCCNWCGREPDGGRRPMASPWLSGRPRCRRLGGRGPRWRCARGTKALLLRRLRVRPRLFRAALLRPERTLLGRMALAHTPRRGLRLTEAR